MSIPNKVSASSVLTHPHRFEGELSLKSLARVTEVLGGLDAPVSVALQADRDSGYPRLHGQLQAELGLRCQRCGRKFDWTLDAAVDLRLVFSEEEEKRVLEGSDPYLIENDELPVRQVVEDEILLALPMLLRCESCENSVMAAAAGKAAQLAENRRKEAVRENPFAALKGKLKH